VSLLGRRRVIQDYLAGALWVLPTLAVVVFLLAGAALSSVEVDADPPLAKLAFQGTADDARPLLMAVSSTMITVTGLVFALTIVALQIASGQYSVGHRRGLPAPAPRPGAGGAVPRASAWATG
jgi:uncharacterized membrane protein